MTTVIVGGPTGVEMAGAVAELVRHALARDFRNIDPRRAKIILIEAGSGFSTFPEALGLCQAALDWSASPAITNEAVNFDRRRGRRGRGRRIDAGTVIWGAGIKASPVSWLGAGADRAGRVELNPDLSVKGAADIYVLWTWRTCPTGTARRCPRWRRSRRSRAITSAAPALIGDAAAEFHNRGNTAIVGRHAAVFDFGWMQLKGRFAWLMWAVIHVYLLVGFDNRLRVSLNGRGPTSPTERALDHARFLFVVVIRDFHVMAGHSPSKAGVNALMSRRDHVWLAN